MGIIIPFNMNTTRRADIYQFVDTVVKRLTIKSPERFRINTDLGMIEVVPHKNIGRDLSHPVKVTVEKSDNGMFILDINIPRNREYLTLVAVEGLIRLIFLNEEGSEALQPVIDALSLAYLESVEDKIVDRETLIDIISYENYGFVGSLFQTNRRVIVDNVLNRLHFSTLVLNLSYSLLEESDIETIKENVHNTFEEILLVFLNTQDKIYDYMFSLR